MAGRLRFIEPAQIFAVLTEARQEWAPALQCRSMVKLLALIAASIAGFLPHAMFGELLSPVADVVVSTIIAAVVYFWVIWYLKRMRGDF